MVTPGAGHCVAEQAPEEMLAALTAFLAPYRDGSATAHTSRQVAAAVRWVTVFERLHMPSLGGATEWLNSEPLGPAGLTAWKGAK